MKRERRFLNQEFSVSESGQGSVISGYAAKFNVLSEDLGGFRETIDAHAFDECIASNPDIVGLFNHDANFVLGRTTAGTMKVSIDSTGLCYEIDAPDTSVARDLLVSMRRKDIKNSSFGFYCRKDKFTADAEGRITRTILKADVFDTSVVTYPAYPDADSQVRTLFPDDKGTLPTEIRTALEEVRANGRPERRYKAVCAAVANTRWAILPETLDTICTLLNARAEGHAFSKQEIQASLMGTDIATSAVSAPSVAVIPVYGVISQRMTLMAELCGGAACGQISSQLRAAIADDSISAVVLDIDSPGGSVSGVPELGAEILASRGKKPIIAVANGMAASAAYWIASAADKLVVTPSGDVGSIGVYQLHQDVSGALEKAGVEVTFIKAGKYKTDGNPYEPLSDSAKAEMQDSVDAYYEMFVEAVASGRGVSVEKVKSDFGQGRMLMAKDAVAAGMADEVATLDDVVAGLLSAPQASPAETTSASAEVVAEAGCACSCDGCQAGDCSMCTNDEFDHGSDDDDDEEASLAEAEVEVMRMRVRIAQAL